MGDAAASNPSLQRDDDDLLVTCDDDAGRAAILDPPHHGHQVQAGELLGNGEQVGGAHNDDAGDEGVHHQVPRPEAEEEGGLHRLHQRLGVHPPI